MSRAGGLISTTKKQENWNTGWRSSETQKDNVFTFRFVSNTQTLVFFDAVFNFESHVSNITRAAL